MWESCAAPRCWIDANEPPHVPGRRAGLPRPWAGRLCADPSGDAGGGLANGPDGSPLWLCGGWGRPTAPSPETWHAHEWVREIKTGPSEAIPYTGLDGT